MGFIIIGISSLTDTGLNGALLQIISHGFIGAALFFLAGTTYDRIRLVYLDEMGGIAIPMPKMFTMFSSFSMASLALPVAKSAQFPLHVWLPDAMEGPTPISALIHAATMVAAGIFLVARLLPLFRVIPYIMYLISVIGIITVLLGATLALAQKDIKRGLAYSTMSQLGYMMLALGIPFNQEGVNLDILSKWLAPSINLLHPKSNNSQDWNEFLKDAVVSILCWWDKRIR
ncbi:NAD(P)H-quinone oxidoreductase subunit 5, chloroplastic-like [Solanum verrucosum]|uniref:NAD(P)H-quinone oxidoreductase subunit 5, chloroplastic-like n=1 Tax=Solanum verrucosum TaxID=315347 RepID=UPI0020D13A85|nr:NAD(P)H-quinone oxidoreductase subunit 5, chloroplastic-like [Solanum verrucosum]